MMAFQFCWSLVTLTIFCGTVQGDVLKTTCSNLQLSIKNGNYTLSKGFEVGSLLIYDCPDGYYSPVKSRRCLATGQWRPFPKRGLQCKQVQCPDPLQFEHGTIEPFQDRYYVNENTTYECFSGYTLYGSATRTCKGNGKWSGKTPICSRNTDHCPDPGVPAGARRTGHIFNIGDVVSYRCEDGQKLIGSSERKCYDSGHWSGQEPECHFDYTFDTPEEVAEEFGSALTNSLKSAETEPNQQEGKKIRLDKGGNINIYIAIDASDSIDKDHFDKAKDVVKKLINKISYYEATPNYDITIFATRVTPIVDIKDSFKGKEKSLIDVLKELDDFKYDQRDEDDTGTNIGKALTWILDNMAFLKQRDPQHFLDSSNVVIMFTDGEANMGPKPDILVKKIKNYVYGNDKKQREDKLDIYMFGLGPEVDQGLLTEYVTDNEGKHVFVLKDLDELHKTFDEMIDESTSVGLCGLHRDYAYKDERESQKRLQQPWLASLSIRHAGGQTSNCMGSLVTPRFVLTAAHCFRFGDTGDSITVDINDGNNRVHRVRKYIPHPNYNTTLKRDKGVPEFFDFDVALVQLEKDVVISAKARTICIPCTKEASGALRLSDSNVKCEDHERLLLNNEYEDASLMSPKREKKDVKIKLGAARQACIEDAKKAKNVTAQNIKDIVTDNFLCTGGISPVTDHVACKGDSGGALFTEYHQRTVQVGVVSWGVEDICEKKTLVNSQEHTRDFHINLFKVQPFLKKYLGDDTADYAPLTFLD